MRQPLGPCARSCIFSRRVKDDRFPVCVARRRGTSEGEEGAGGEAVWCKDEAGQGCKRVKGEVLKRPGTAGERKVSEGRCSVVRTRRTFSHS